MTTKTCIICKVPKAMDDMVRQAKSPDGRSSYCKVCSRAKTKQWTANNKEHLKAIRRAWIKTPKARETRKRYVAANKPRIKHLQKRFNDLNPEKVLLYEARKRAKKRGTPCTITHKDIHIPEFCPILGIPLSRSIGQLSDNSPTLDAIVPDFGYTPENIAVISHRANRIKTDASLDELQAVTNWVRQKLSASYGTETCDALYGAETVEL